MKTITIRLPDVEAAMLAELQKKIPKLRDINSYFLAELRACYKQAIVKG